MKRASVAAARAHLVHDLCARGAITNARLAEAFQRVPRHVFLPDLDPIAAYEDRAIPIRIDADTTISSCSQPTMTALMLAALAPRSEERVLEIGTGSGYHAALLKELVGRRGTVVSVDIEAELIASARRYLDEAGYPGIVLEHRDGRTGAPELAPFDAVIATAAVDDIPPAWVEQLRFGGRLLAPITMLRYPLVVLFERRARSIASRTALAGLFLPLRGNGIETAAEPTVAERFGDVADEPPRTLRLDLRPEQTAAFELWLAINDDTYVRVRRAGERGGALWFDGELAELPATAHATEAMLRGPDRGAAARLARAVVEWRALGEPSIDRIRIEGYGDAREAADSVLARQLGAVSIERPGTVLVVGWD